jgi:hypothetical protein
MGNNIKARVSHMHDTESNWNRCKSFIPEIAEPIIYDPDETYPYTRMKVGDGKTTISALPFISVDRSQLAMQLGVEWYGDTGVIDSGRITSYSNNTEVTPSEE